MSTNLMNYHLYTRRDVMLLLEEIHRNGQRVRLWYGNNKTGQCWGDYIDGRISRSTGTIKIPISVHNSRSLGGSAILADCIVKIQLTKGKKVLWQHPLYKPFVCPHCDNEHGVRDACLERPARWKEGAHGIS